MYNHIMNESVSPVPKVSVIIPLYNKAPYIKRALDSVLAQTVQDFEIVVVGGNSSDGGEDIVKGYTDSRIRFIQEAGNGVSAARNQGVDAAKAELVAFLDADDEWLPEFLETILRLREKWPEGGIYSTSWIVADPGKPLKKHKSMCIADDWEGVLPSVFIVAAKDGGFPGYTSSIVIPRSIYIQSNGFSTKYKLGEDLDLWARLSLYYPWVGSSDALAIYHQDDANSAVRNPALLHEEEHPIIQSFQTLFTQDEQQRLLKTAPDLDVYLDSLHLWKAGNLITLGKKKQALVELKKITHKELNLRKRMLYLRISIPDEVLPAARKVWKVVNVLHQ